MKQIVALIFLLGISCMTRAQRATFKNDTARYHGRSYTVADTIRLGTGSQQDKSFAFISMGWEQSSLAELGKTYAQAEVIIDRIYILRKTIYINAGLIDRSGNMSGTTKILIDLEAAVDNNEIPE
jgi:hypothetical protein